jgi:hypothetical protein
MSVMRRCACEGRSKGLQYRQDTNETGLLRRSLREQGSPDLRCVTGQGISVGQSMAYYTWHTTDTPLDHIGTPYTRTRMTCERTQLAVA